ncbi:glycosyltransferase family 2 protein [Candidatus Pelagibacter bacterium]|nr:glycosyltransferase family 2 protein [Candidatus Pelagibacter bacterium]
MLISVLIPCFNEKKTIEEIVNRINDLKDLNLEIIIIDDNSNDGTKELLKDKIKDKVSKIIFNNKNYGKGYCVKKGIQASNGDAILIQDADLEYDPSDYPKLIKPIENGNADVVYGSRFLGGEEKRVLYFWHSLGNKLLTIFSNMFTNLNLTDMEVGYKLFKSDILKDINLVENRFGIEPEVTAKISKKKIRIFEVGISYYGRKYEDGKKITWRDGFSAIRCIIKYNLFD